MTATVTGGTTATGSTAPAGSAAGPGGSPSGPARRRRIGLPRASTTPGKVRLIRAGLVILCLGWGALAAVMIGQHASAAGDVVGTSEPLSLKAQQMASVAGVAALAWLVVALAGGRSDLLQATRHGSTPAETLAQAGIAALQARGDETLNLISRTGDSDFQQDFRVAQGEFSMRLTAANTQSTVDAAGPTTAASRDASSWFAVNQQAQQLDHAFDYGAETQLEIGSAGTLFGRLESDLTAAIHADQAVFASSAAAGSGAFTGLEAGVVVLALAMAVGCAWGLSRRLAEYR